MRRVRRLLAADGVPERRLQASVASLPLSVRIAMLDGVRCERIIAGAYTDGTGGVCPMLAAHRRGARSSFLPFAKAWDAYANASLRSHRPAGADAVAHLTALLRHSIECDVVSSDAVPDPRRDSQLTMDDRFHAIVEHATDRQVITSISGDRDEPGLVAETFVLARD